MPIKSELLACEHEFDRKTEACLGCGLPRSGLEDFPKLLRCPNPRTPQNTEGQSHVE